MAPHMTEDQLQESIIKASKGYMKTAANYCIDYHDVLSTFNYTAAKAWKQFQTKPEMFESYEKERNYLNRAFKFAFLNLIRDDKTKKKKDDIMLQIFKNGFYVYKNSKSKIIAKCVYW